jgi:hypothetical protein
METTTTKPTTHKVPDKLISGGKTNAKTIKNDIETLILYLAPFTQNSKGINLCPKATDGCAAACLFTAGRGAFPKNIQARMNRTEYYLHDRKGFLAQLAKEINEVAKLTDKLAVRLNGTSDVKLVEMLTLAHEILPNVVFYDYTKIERKAGPRKTVQGHDYIVAYSFNESPDAIPNALQVLNRGGNVAVVFRKELPDTFLGYPVIDGDQSDIMMLYNRGVILGLKAKGKAKKDTTGFVID